MIIIPVFCLLGIFLALAFDIYIPPNLTAYIAVFIISCVDSLLSAYKSELRGKFSFSVFVTGFFGNSLLAALFVFIGKKIELDLYYAVIIVFTMRIFSSVSFVRRHILKKITQKLKKC